MRVMFPSRFRAWRLSMALALAPACWATGATADASKEPVNELSGMSLAELTKVEVTSVSKSPQALSSAAATVYVITREEILRSGAHSIPEVLRLAPNLQVNQVTASSYAITARGFAGSPPAQNFSNKILIMIDGRSVYSPLFSGVFYDQVDTLPEDIDRVEVISGPGATLWGANAMNGVINIITRSAKQTGGTMLRAFGGNQEQNFGARYGATLSAAQSYRVYGMGFEREALEFADGSNAHDQFRKAQVGFRSDWSAGADAITVQGDAYRGTEEQLGAPEVPISGLNALARWQHSTERTQWQLQTYVDHSETGRPLSGAGFVLNTYDVELQQAIDFSARTDLIWGVGERVSDYHMDNAPTFLILPAHRRLNLTNVFIEGSYAPAESLRLTAGIKLENDPYSQWSVMPNARLAWTLNAANLMWAAASRAVRSPTPFDTDVVEKLGSTVFLTGDPDFRSEKVTTYEVGYRGQAGSLFTVSASLYYNEYDDLRTIEPASSQVFLPVHWGNLMAGHSYGVTVWANLQVASWWRLSPAIRTLSENFHFKSGASTLLGLSQAGDDPETVASLKSSMTFGPATVDAMLRYVSALPDPAVPAYTELNLRAAWQVSPKGQLALVGTNLLHAHHQEFPGNEFIPRGYGIEARFGL